MSKKIASAIAILGISMILGSSAYAAPLKPKGYGGGPGCDIPRHYDDKDDKSKKNDKDKKDKKDKDDKCEDEDTGPKPNQQEINRMREVIIAWLRSLRNH